VAIHEDERQVKMNVLIFSPFPRIVQHSIPEATVIGELRRAGHNVMTITCGEALRGQCVTLDALGRQNASDAVVSMTCRECVACGETLHPDALLLADLIDVDRAQIKEKIKNAMIGLGPGNFMDFKYDDLQIGRLAAYQHMINFKKFTEQISEEEFPKFAREVENCLTVLFALDAFSKKQLFAPDVVMTYNSLYSVNAVFCAFFARKGAKIYSLHAGANLRSFYDTMLLMPDNTFRYLKMLIENYNANNVTLTEKDAKHVISHFKELSLGRSAFAYSKKADHNSTPDIRQKFRVNANSKILLAAMSSYDERFSAEFCGHLAKSQDSVFGSQIDWVKWLVDWARSRNDVHLIIRLHPREFPNKREGVQSLHALQVLEALKDLPNNVSINVPADNLSLYDIAREVDVALTAWSSVGKELMLLGIPLVMFTSDSQWFPSSLASCASSSSEYANMIEKAMAEGWSIRNSIGVLKWLVYETRHNTYELSTRLSPAGRLWPTEIVFRVFKKFLGPDFGVNLRVGRILNSDTFLSALVTGKLKSQLQRHSRVGKMDSDFAVAHRQLQALGTIMFGRNRSRWPSKFIGLLQLK
jgi:hypothetical protein